MLHEIQAKSILRKSNKIDSWFISSYGLNLYRGCTHNCTYCDGRNEKYQVNGEFGTDIEVKVNALEILEKELDPARKRKPFQNGFIALGGGVSDSYQSFEKRYEITRGALELLYRFHHPVHMLTKSTLIERDLDLLKKIHKQAGALISFSFSTVDDPAARLLEPGVPSPSRRLETIKRFKDAGLHCGMFLMPVVPYITDSEEMIEASVAAAKDAGVDYIVFAGMTLKMGRQKEYFIKFLQKSFPELIGKYESLYGNQDPYGAPSHYYATDVGHFFDHAASKYKIPKRVPASIFREMVTKTELVVLILEQLDYLLSLKGQKSPYGFGAHSLHKSGVLVETLSSSELLALKGIGPVTVKIIEEILRTGTSSYYERVL